MIKLYTQNTQEARVVDSCTEFSKLSPDASLLERKLWRILNWLDGISKHAYTYDDLIVYLCLVV